MIKGVKEVVVVVDVVSSTTAKHEYGQDRGNKMIAAALHFAEVSLCSADPNLRNPRLASAGDNLLLVGGTLTLEVYRAAKLHQSVFEGWPWNRLAVKIAIGHADYEEMTNEHGIVSLRGSDLDLMFRLVEHCPASTVVIMPSIYSELAEAGFGQTLNRRLEVLNGFGQFTFYECDGSYVIPAHMLQRVHDKPFNFALDCPAVKIAEDVAAIKKSMDDTWLEKFLRKFGRK